MKRVIIFSSVFVFLVFNGGFLWADPTTSQDAQLAVKGWLSLDGTPLNAPLSESVATVETYTNDKGQPIYYIVYLAPEGFVIVPADDQIEPIIGFVEHGIYDASLDNPLGALVSMDLNERMACVRAVGKAPLNGQGPAAGAYQNKWGQLISLAQEGDSEGDVGIMGLGSIDDVRVDPLVESHWHQKNCCSSPALACYNYYTPRKSGGVVYWDEGNTNNYYCGCVATAMAQLMRYHQYPTSGIGQNSFQVTIDGGSATNRTTRGGNGAGGAYDWANMVLNPGCSTTLTQRKAVGALCYDAALTVNMDFGSNSSTADTRRAATAFRTTFQYGNAIRGYNGGDNIGSTALNKMVNPNLAAKAPVLLGITGSSGGHAVVCDGYGYNSSTMYHHLNMGWAGSNDAWYNLPDINSSPSFSSVYKCVYNVHIIGGSVGSEVISGRVFDPDGLPMDSPLVYAEPVGQQFWIGGESNSHGEYGISALNSNTSYYVSAQMQGYVFTKPMATTGASADDVTTCGNVTGININAAILDITSISPSSGPIGSYIKIEGHNFRNNPGTVVFTHDFVDGVNTVWSDTVIYCRVPSGVWSGDVKIYTNDFHLSFPYCFDVTTPSTVYVDDDTDEIEDGTAQYPLAEIQLGINAVAANGTVIVNPGTYYENINYNGKIITVRGTDPNDPAVVASTIIDGGQDDSVVTFENGEDTNCLLSGFTITNGFSEFDGGGISCLQSSPTISHCVVTGNSSNSWGGGLRCIESANAIVNYCSFSNNTANNGGGISCINSSNADIDNCLITGNSAVNGGGGGGLYFNYSSPTLKNSLISNNFLVGEYTYGGGLNNFSACPTIINCQFVGNQASWQGGGVYNNYNSHASMINCIFKNHSVADKGAALANMNSNPSLVNCLFVNNLATNGGGAIYNWAGNYSIINCTFSGNFGAAGKRVLINENTTTAFANCIVWGNGDNLDDEIYNDFTSTTTITYSDIQAGFAGAGNINSDPEFVDPGNADPDQRDYRLQSTSACIDTGSNAAVPADSKDIDNDGNTGEDIPWDLDSNARLIDGDCDDTTTVDMGAYEFAYPGDLTGNCRVDMPDWAVFAAHWLDSPCSPQNNWCDGADINHLDNVVDINDLSKFAQSWLAGLY